MAPLMPMVLEPLAAVTGAHFELIPVVNSLFGPPSPRRDCCRARRCARPSRPFSDLDLALLPGESLNDDALFIDSMSFDALAESIPFEIRTSKDFADALADSGGGVSRPTVAIVGRPEHRQVHALQPDSRRTPRDRFVATGHDSRPSLRRGRVERAALLADRYGWPDSRLRRGDGPRNPPAGRLRPRRSRSRSLRGRWSGRRQSGGPRHRRSASSGGTTGRGRREQTRRPRAEHRALRFLSTRLR